MDNFQLHQQALAATRLKTVGDIFAGGGGWSLGAVAAGFTPIWAIEHDRAVAEVYAANLGDHIIVQAAQDVDIRKLEAPDLLLASPPCQNHSIARSKKLAARADAEVGLCVLEYARKLCPRFVMIENVEGWKRSHSFKAIFHGLFELGYFVNVQVLNAASFGVPQTRRRLILRASREGWLPALSPPTPWRGWYSAIEDLIDGLPESRFANWQLKRLDGYLPDASFLQMSSATSDHQDTRGNGVKRTDEPAGTVVPNSGHARAFLVGNQTTKGGNGVCVTAADEPSPTVCASLHSKSKMPHAFIVRSSDQRENCNIARYEQEPIFTLTEGNTAHGRVKAFLVDSQNASYARAWLEQGRVVAMTPRALARFQSIPDGYKLPDKAGLACRIIGNAVPPLMAQSLIGAFA